MTRDNPSDGGTDRNFLVGLRKTVKRTRVGEKVNRNHNCVRCGSENVLWGELRVYGLEVVVMDWSRFIKKGSNVYCESCRDVIGNRLTQREVGSPMTEPDEQRTAYPFKCPFCSYEYRKERYIGRHLFTEHPEKVVKTGLDPQEVVRYNVE